MLTIPATTPPAEPDGDSWFEWIVGPLLENIWSPILCAANRAYCWVSESFIEFAIEMLGTLEESFPDLQEHVDSVEYFATWLGLVDAWFPLTEGFTLLGGAITWITALVLIRVVRRLMPF